MWGAGPASGSRDESAVIAWWSAVDGRGGPGGTGGALTAHCRLGGGNAASCHPQCPWQPQSSTPTPGWFRSHSGVSSCGETAKS